MCQSALKRISLPYLQNRLTTLIDQGHKSGVWSSVSPEMNICAGVIVNSFLKHIVNLPMLHKWERLLFDFVRDTVGKEMIDRLFDIVSAFPKSQPTITDLRICLRKGPEIRSRLVTSFCNQVSERLLQAGACTKEIIDHFLNAARFFAEIDPKGEIIDEIGRTYQQYLMTRQDTMKHIVAVLADTRPDQPCILEELADTQVDVFDDEDDNPESCALKEIRKMICRAASPPKPNQAEVAVYDVLSALVGVRNSQDAFIEAYQKLLADQLLERHNYGASRECRVLELLKKRYGETPLHKCEVMLNDVVQSKSLNATLHQDIVKKFSEEQTLANRRYCQSMKVSALMVSYLFWPEAKEPQINLPEDISNALEVYGEQYSSRKYPRMLNWRTGAGIVVLHVTVGSISTQHTVSPTQATIILMFRGTPRLSEAELVTGIGISAAVLKGKIMYWISNGVLREIVENGNVWYVRNRSLEQPTTTLMEDSDDEMLDATPETDQMAIGKYDCFRTYVVDYLNHHKGGAPLDNIHRHLEVFVRQHKYDWNQAELADYLNTLVKDRSIILTNGTYRNNQP